MLLTEIWETCSNHQKPAYSYQFPRTVTTNNTPVWNNISQSPGEVRLTRIFWKYCWRLKNQKK